MDLAVILAGGSASRFHGKDKCGIEVDGESLVRRTSRLLHRSSSSPVVVAASLGRRYTSDPHLLSEVGSDANRFRAARELWPPGGVVGLFYGDVWFSEEAFAQILSAPSRPITWCGRSRASTLTGKRYGEIFAVIFGVDSPFLTAVDHVEEMCLSGQIPRCIGWNVREYLRRNGVDGWVEIDDLTEDFDCQEDLDVWGARSGLPWIVP